MARKLLAVALLCLGLCYACGEAAMPSRSRSLLQSGPARFMNAPLTNIARLEALQEDEDGPAHWQPKQYTAEQANASSPKAAVKRNATAELSTQAKPQQQQQQQQQQPQQQQPQQQRSLLAADSTDSADHHRHRHRHHDKRWRKEQVRRYRRYDRGTLSPLITSANSYSSVRRQPLPALTGLLGSLLLTGNPQGTAQSLASAYSGGNSEAAAQAVASAAAGSGAAQANTVAQAISEAASSHPNVAPGLLAKSADLAVRRGQTDRYAQTLAKSFGYAKKQRQVPQLTNAVIQAITTGGDAARYASGTAIATAIAQGGDSKAAVAEATATALCDGGSRAQAWSSAYAVALSQDSNGCLVLNEARAMAQARCGEGAADAVADAEASSTVLGFCGLLEGLFPDTEMSWSGGNSGSSSASDGWGRQGTWGQGSWGQSGWGK